jgi:hypothetical protein
MNLIIPQDPEIISDDLEPTCPECGEPRRDRYTVLRTVAPGKILVRHNVTGQTAVFERSDD